MKTPKRIIPCPKCGAPCEIGISVIESWDECFEVPAFICTRSGEEVEINKVRAICARIIRKNREARLRHKIAVLKKQVKKAYEDGRTDELHRQNCLRARREGVEWILRDMLRNEEERSVDAWRETLQEVYEAKLDIDMLQHILSTESLDVYRGDDGELNFCCLESDDCFIAEAKYLVTEYDSVNEAKEGSMYETRYGAQLPWTKIIAHVNNAADAYEIARTDWYGRHRQVIRTVWEHYGPEDEVNWRIAYHILGQAEMTPLMFGSEKGETE